MADIGPTFGIAEVLNTLWSDLEQAEVAIKTGRRNQMSISSASVEIAFTVTSKTSGGGGLSIRVFGVGADGKVSKSTASERVHRVTINLEPSDEKSELEVPGHAPPTSRLIKRPQRVPGTAKRAPAKRTAKRSTGKRSSSRRAAKR